MTPDNRLFKSLAETVTGPDLAPDWISPEMRQTARLMLPNAPQENLDKYLAPVLKALRSRGMADPAMLEYSLATMNAENDSFKSTSELSLTRNAAVSDLSARQRQQLADAQRLYVRQTIARTEQALTAKEGAQRARRATQNRAQSPQQ